jgi:hypothetical protein
MAQTAPTDPTDPTDSTITMLSENGKKMEDHIEFLGQCVNFASPSTAHEAQAPLLVVATLKLVEACSAFSNVEDNVAVDDIGLGPKMTTRELSPMDPYIKHTLATIKGFVPLSTILQALAPHGEVNYTCMLGARIGGKKIVIQCTEVCDIVVIGTPKPGIDAYVAPKLRRTLIHFVEDGTVHILEEDVEVSNPKKASIASMSHIRNKVHPRGIAATWLKLIMMHGLERVLDGSVTL